LSVYDRSWVRFIRTGTAWKRDDHRSSGRLWIIRQIRRAEGCALVFCRASV